MSVYDLYSEELQIDQTNSEARRMQDAFEEAFAHEALIQRMTLTQEGESSADEQDEDEGDESDEEPSTSANEREYDGNSFSEEQEADEEPSTSEEESVEEGPSSDDEESDAEPWIFGRPDALDEVLLCEQNEESRAHEGFLFPRLPSYQEAMREGRPPLYEDEIISHLLPFISPPLYENGTLIVGAPPPYDGPQASTTFPQGLLPEAGIFSSNACAARIQPVSVTSYLSVTRDFLEDEGPVNDNWLFGESSLDSSPEVTVEIRTTPLHTPRLLAYEDLFGTATQRIEGTSTSSSGTGLFVIEQLHVSEAMEVNEHTHSISTRSFAGRLRAFSMTKFLRLSTRLLASCISGNREN